jgi:hypothetical protein
MTTELYKLRNNTSVLEALVQNKLAPSSRPADIWGSGGTVPLILDIDTILRTAVGFQIAG